MDDSAKSVDVISVFSADGNIKPLRVQFLDDSRQMIRMNIESVIKCENIAIVGAEAMIFQCKANLWGQKCIFELKYSIRGHNWSLLRRLH